MPASGVRISTAKELERLGENDLESRFGLALRAPVDVDFLVEKSEGIDLDFYPKLKANHGILGGVWRDVDTGELFIDIDEDLADDDSPLGWARYRMTVAEELAHVQLHRTLIDAINGAHDFHVLHNHPQWNDIERNAKRFAAAILMPASTLSMEAGRSYAHIVGRPEIRPRLREADAASRWSDPVTKWMCKELALRFEVSETAMKHRLGEWPARINDRVTQSLDAGSDSLL